MPQIFFSIIVAFLSSIPITLGMGFIYFALASFIVNFFELNTGPKPIGFKILNLAVLITIFTFFISFAILVRRI